MTLRIARLVSFVAAAFLVTASLLALDEPPLVNWTVPGGASGRHLSPLGDIGSPSTFVSIAPCRVMDTRGGAPLGGGAGPFTSGQTRSYALNAAAAPCNGIPAGVAGYSLNVTATNETGTGYVAIYPTENPPNPMVSLLNYKAGAAIANSTIVPCDASGSITVLNQGATAAVVLDINGYFTNSLNASEQLWISTVNGQAAIVGFNYSNTDGSHGVGGYEGGTGKVHGMQGQVSDSAGAGSSAVHGIGGTTTTVATYGVLGESWATGSGSAAVFGNAAATTGTVSGVTGQSASSDGYSSGVQGIATNEFGNAGLFTNPGNGGGAVNTYIATVGIPGSPAPAGNQNYGLWVHGGNAYVSSGVYALSKSFVAPHPTDPSKEIVYMSVEAPSADIYFRGTAHLVSGVATIEVPEHFRANARSETYQTNLTVVGARASAWVESEGPQGIVIRGTGEIVHYMVYAERDILEPQLPVRENVHFNAAALSRGDVRSLPKGYLELLVKNGTLNPDLTLNKRTAERLGWAIPVGVEAR